MRKDKEKALKLRLQGRSYTEIMRLLGVPKGTLSGWFGNLALSEKALQRIRSRVREGSLKGLLKKNRRQTHEARRRATIMRNGAKAEIPPKLSKQDMLLIGAALYWAEGYKKLIVKNGKERTYHTISFVNADPVMIRLFLRFLTTILQIPQAKIYASVRIFQHNNEKETLAYWQQITKLPMENFRKFYYGISRSSLGKRPYNRLPYGTIQIVVGDTQNFHRIMGWIEGIKKHFL